MSIISSIDNQALVLTKKLLPELQATLKETGQATHQYSSELDQVWIDTDLQQIQTVIESLLLLNQQWQKDTHTPHRNERDKIMAYLLRQWIHVGEEAKHSAALGRWSRHVN